VARPFPMPEPAAGGGPSPAAELKLRGRGAYQGRRSSFRRSQRIVSESRSSLVCSDARLLGVRAPPCQRLI